MIRRSVDFPHPDGPISETNSPGAIVEVDVLERECRPCGRTSSGPGSRRRSGSAHARCSGARRTTSLSASTTATKKTMPSTAQTMFVAHSNGGWIE